MKLDLIDRKLLYELDQNCRKSLNVVAKKLRIGRNVALYRLNRLKKLGIIKGTFTEINNVALGYYSFRIFLKLGNFTKNKKEQLINFILHQKNTTFLSEVLGKYDLDLVYTTKNIFKFNDFNKELKIKFNDILEQNHISLLTQIHHYAKDYLIDKKRSHVEIKIYDPTIQIQLDIKDEAILYAIAKNASQGILELSNKLKLSINTIKKRMKNLEKNNIILGYRLFIDTNKLGYFYYKLHINLRHYQKDHIERLRKFLESKNFIIYTDHYIGGEDFEIELHLKTEKEYLYFIDELNEKFGKIIKDHFVLKFHKEYIFRYLPEK